ncbi:tetratricopeptide repeat protein [Marinobacter sp. X15-166B]|uniref:tetratricopeptide repeat protein n=1 Tax=Marinobacter sp. X15-166B TaxID=1897620 RepID=UPI00085C9365|nr:tetratricopeptide repeat protein [Marinobacter sp. X15-166B]OEY66849.1 hypothetical protein BG841_10545 [Marinobacter sp. X15-166B]
MQKTALLLATSLLATFIAGCAALKSEPAESSDTPADQVIRITPAENTAPVEYAELDPEVLYLLTSAEIAAQRGRYDITLGNYVRAAEISRDRSVITRAMRIAQSLNGDNAQLRLAQLWLEVEPDSMAALRILAIQAVQRNDLKTALQHMERIMDLGGDADFDNLAALASNLPPESQQELLVLYQQLSERYPDNLEIEYSIALLLKIAKQPNTALVRLEPILQQHPNFQPALVLKGDLLYQAGQPTAALDYLQRTTRRYPQNRQMGTLYGRMLVSEGEMQGAQDEFARLMKAFPNIPGLRLSHALIAIENGEPELARDDLHLLIEQGHHLDEAHFYLGKIADEQDLTEQALSYYEQVTEGGHYFAALARISALRAADGDVDGALTRLQQLKAVNPEQAESFWLLEINLLLDSDRHQQAFETAGAGLAALPDSIRIRYARAMMHDRDGNIADAEKDLRAILEREPENAVTLNALGYILTSQPQRLDESEALIRRALQLAPDNAAIMDSMGWVLFLQGHPAEALDYLKQAYSAYPDPEVAAHLGEVLWEMGEQEQARIIWRESLQDFPEHPTLIETIERLTDGPTR